MNEYCYLFGALRFQHKFLFNLSLGVLQIARLEGLCSYAVPLSVGVCAVLVLRRVRGYFEIAVLMRKLFSVFHCERVKDSPHTSFADVRGCVS